MNRGRGDPAARLRRAGVAGVHMRRVVVAGVALVVLGCPKGQVDSSVGEVTATTGTPGGSTTTGAPTTGVPTTGVPTTGSSSGGSSGGSSSGGESSGGSSSGVGEASSGTGGTGTSTGGSTSTGTGTGGSSSTGEAPLLFDCFGCTCDAQVSFCRQVFAGFAGPDLPACPVVPEEGLGSGCVLYPVNCDPPSCACLPTMNNNCFCTEQAPGAFEVTCPLP